MPRRKPTVEQMEKAIDVAHVEFFNVDEYFSPSNSFEPAILTTLERYWIVKDKTGKEYVFRMRDAEGKL